MIPCYDFQPWEVNCLTMEVKMSQNDSVKAEFQGCFLVKGNGKVANLLSPVIQAAQVPVGSSFCS